MVRRAVQYDKSVLSRYIKKPFHGWRDSIGEQLLQNMQQLPVPADAAWRWRRARASAEVGVEGRSGGGHFHAVVQADPTADDLLDEGQRVDLTSSR